MGSFYVSYYMAYRNISEKKTQKKVIMLVVSKERKSD